MLAWASAEVVKKFLTGPQGSPRSSLCSTVQTPLVKEPLMNNSPERDREVMRSSALNAVGVTRALDNNTALPVRRNNRMDFIASLVTYEERAKVLRINLPEALLVPFKTRSLLHRLAKVSQLDARLRTFPR